MFLKTGDKVRVITGKDKGKEGTIKKTLAKENRVIVEGVNMIKKHLKARKQNDPTGIVDREGSIDASNLMLVCPKCGKPTRVAHVVNADGSKNRVCKKCGAVISNIKKADKGE